MILSYFAGGRDGVCAMCFVDDLRSRLANRVYAVALHMMYYNFVKVHSKLRVSPALAAGVSERLWEISDIFALVEAEEAKIDRKRGPYKKKGQG